MGIISSRNRNPSSCCGRDPRHSASISKSKKMQSRRNKPNIIDLIFMDKFIISEHPLGFIVRLNCSSIWVRMNFGKSGKTFASFFTLAAILPVVLFGALSPERLNFLTSADQPGELRVWIEPETVVAKIGTEARLRVYAEFDDRTKLIPQLSLQVVSDSSLKLITEQIDYPSAFAGKTEIGVIRFKALQTGTSRIEIPKEQIKISLDGISIVTGSTTVVVR